MPYKAYKFLDIPKGITAVATGFIADEFLTVPEAISRVASAFIVPGPRISESTGFIHKYSAEISTKEVAWTGLPEAVISESTGFIPSLTSPAADAILAESTVFLSYDAKTCEDNKDDKTQTGYKQIANTSDYNKADANRLPDNTSISSSFSSDVCNTGVKKRKVGDATPVSSFHTETDEYIHPRFKSFRKTRKIPNAKQILCIDNVPSDIEKRPKMIAKRGRFQQESIPSLESSPPSHSAGLQDASNEFSAKKVNVAANCTDTLKPSHKRKLRSPSPLARDAHSDDDTETDEKLIRVAKRQKLKERMVCFDPTNHKKIPKPRGKSVAFVEDGHNTDQNNNISHEMVEKAILHLQKKYMHGLFPDKCVDDNFATNKADAKPKGVRFQTPSYKDVPKKRVLFNDACANKYKQPGSTTYTERATNAVSYKAVVNVDTDSKLHKDIPDQRTTPYASDKDGNDVHRNTLSIKRNPTQIKILKAKRILLAASSKRGYKLSKKERRPIKRKHENQCDVSSLDTSLKRVKYIHEKSGKELYEYIPLLVSDINPYMGTELIDDEMCDAEVESIMELYGDYGVYPHRQIPKEHNGAPFFQKGQTVRKRIATPYAKCSFQVPQANDDNMSGPVYQPLFDDEPPHLYGVSSLPSTPITERCMPTLTPEPPCSTIYAATNMNGEDQSVYVEENGPSHVKLRSSVPTTATISGSSAFSPVIINDDIDDETEITDDTLEEAYNNFVSFGRAVQPSCSHRYRSPTPRPSFCHDNVDDDDDGCEDDNEEADCHEETSDIDNECVNQKVLKFKMTGDDDYIRYEQPVTFKSCHTNETISCIRPKSGHFKVMTTTDQPPRRATTIVKIGDVDVASASIHCNRVPQTTEQQEMSRLSVPSIMKIGDINTENAPLQWRRGKHTGES